MNAQEQAADAEPQSEPLTFESLNLTVEVMQALSEIGYVEPTPVQHATYAPAVAGRDLIVQARTGTGKTAAFGIPLVDKIVTSEPGVQALILAPTRELALQSAREVERLGQHRNVRTTAVYGGAPMGSQIDALAGGAQIVSGTPGRVLDHLRRGTLDSSAMRVLVLDEMDEMLSMGFAKELNAILELIPTIDKRQTMCFSATVDGQVQRHAQKHMKDPEMVQLSSDAVGATQVTHYAYMVSGARRAEDLVEILNIEDPESAIVFCNMRSETERVAAQLQQAGFNADWLNGDLPQRDRERIMASTREGRLRYLVATDVAARGIDISHLTHVINFSFPESPASYVHRTGRTGRAGKTGCAISLISPQELGRLYYLRLEFNISPVERSLPNASELSTRRELDRIKLLEDAVGRGSADHRALAQRLMTHPEAETILGGLLKTFFGDKDDVDEQAAAARRSRRPDPVAAPEPERSSERTPRRRQRSADDERPAKTEAKTAEQSTESAEGTESGEPTRKRRPRARRGESEGEADSAEAAAGSGSDSEERAPRRPRESDSNADEATLYLKIGKKDGARVGEIARVMRETGGLERSEVGRIRVRDRYTLVGLPEAKVDSTLTALAEAKLDEQPLGAERAKVTSKQ